MNIVSKKGCAARTGFVDSERCFAPLVLLAGPAAAGISVKTSYEDANLPAAQQEPESSREKSFSWLVR
jgi:hypothetical protein